MMFCEVCTDTIFRSSKSRPFSPCPAYNFWFADVNVAFQRAAHKVLLDDDNLLPLLHLTVDYQGKDKGEVVAAAAI